ncbi:hypothetical protein P154DRAFT_490637 [Amniculicola lignicola CBS 123094]|uniref:Uncharacterized protein n=1 Tax=Amniculicola lignicola CBS 123094 TaxID=1392246 RepID=A0A6A5WH69_9PLEO|nr:hypothetical protein P154DRAFT_490637 [Amniculicola lignicola CBS 123094]
MSISQADVTQHIAPPSRFTNEPLTPPLTDKKLFAGALRVIAFFRHIQAGENIKQGPWIEFQLAQGEYDEIERTLQQDDVLAGYVKDKIRYDYDEDRGRLVVRMPTGVHGLFIDKVEDAIRTQLKIIRSKSGRSAQFAQKVHPARSTEINFTTSALSSKSKYEPDESFWHDDAQYPGVIIEVAYSQKKKRLGRLAENYLLDSDASVRVVVGLDIEYSEKGSRKASLSMWRPRLFETADGSELRAVEEAVNEPFRDDEGNPVDHPGLRLRLSDFTYEELAQAEMGDEDAEIFIPGIQLCQYLAAAESKAQRAQPLGKHSFVHEVKKRKRLETPPEEITAGDEARYAEDEQRATKRTVSHDHDYIVTASTKRFSE